MPDKTDKPLPMARISYAELLSLRADRERLDWLERHSFRATPKNVPSVYVVAHSTVWPSGVPNKLRRAIDTAMVGQRCPDNAVEFPECGSKAWIDREIERSIEKGD